jgi:hypothetical protein
VGDVLGSQVVVESWIPLGAAGAHRELGVDASGADRGDPDFFGPDLAIESAARPT